MMQRQEHSREPNNGSTIFVQRERIRLSSREHTAAVGAGAVRLHEVHQLVEAVVHGLEELPGAAAMVRQHGLTTPADHLGIIGADQG
jgi:hypothetical protein